MYSFWIQVHGLPLNQMTKENAEKIGNIFNGLLEIDLVSNEDVLVRLCLRIRVLIDTIKPLYEGFSNRKEDGSLERVRFRFERLPDFLSYVWHV